MVKHYKIQPSPHSHIVCSRFDLIDEKLSLLQVQGRNIRLVLRNIDIILQCKLGEGLNSDAVHMYISFYQFHKNTSIYTRI